MYDYSKILENINNLRLKNKTKFYFRLNTDEINFIKDYVFDNFNIDKNIKFSRILWHFINNQNNPICKCGNFKNFKNLSHGYHEYCSKNCASSFRYTDEFKLKKSITCIKIYGVDHPLKSKIIREKIINTCIKNNGVENPLQNKSILNKKNQTCLERYGTINPLQNSQVLIKNQKSNFKLKEYRLPSGKIILVQGFENKALDELIKKYPEEDIFRCDLAIEKEIGIIWYIGIDGKPHRYYPDIYIKSENKIIEVKSNYTFNKMLEINLLKEQSCKDLGLKFEFLIL